MKLIVSIVTLLHVFLKQLGIPSLNVCMNCHKNISEYTGEEDLANGYTKEFYTNEIKKLYAAVGWDEETQSYTGKTEPVKWVRIHNRLILLILIMLNTLRLVVLSVKHVTARLRKWR